MEIKETKEIKPTSFRISEDARERFKEITKSENWTQDEALNKLIGIYEIEQAKITISSRKMEIETFETHLQALSEVYRMSLQLNQDAEERIKSAYSNTLESNQKTIQELQVKIEDLRESLETSKNLLNDSDQELDQLRKENQQLYSEIKKTDSLCNEYKEKNDNLNGVLIGYKEDREENKKLNVQLQEQEKQIYTLKNKSDESQTKVKSLEVEVKSLEAKEKENIITLKKQAETDLKLATLEIKEKYNNQIEQLKSKHNEEIEKSNTNYRNLLEELEQLRKENHKLLEQNLLQPPAKKPATRKRTTKTTTIEAEQKE